MKKIIAIFYLLFLCNSIYSQDVKIITNIGNITIKLYDETPFHTENFLKLIKEKFYDSLLFHRVIKDFMIQTGDPQSKHAKAGQFLGRGNVNYTIPPEFKKEYYHKKGALSAARLGDNINPKKESSGCQFFIVTGKVYSQEELDIMESRGVHIKFTEEQRKIYSTIGGAPHLDYGYTVFGEVTEGIEIVEKITHSSTDKNDRPLNDIRIKKITLLK